jgi:SAM-dependent methyltransferase
MTILPDDVSNRLGLTSLEDERIAAVLPWIHGRLLDVGAGRNRLVAEYGSGVGVDVHDWGGGVMVLPDSRHLPFDDESFETVTFLACLNHIPERVDALREAWRVLVPSGRMIATMIDPILSGIGHRWLWWYSEEKHRGGMRPGEVYGLWPREMRHLISAARFELAHYERFVYGLNHLYVAMKSTSAERTVDN